MNYKMVVSAASALLACIGFAFIGPRVSARCSPTISECRGEASYTTTSLGVPFDVSFDFSLREKDGVDVGWVFVRTSPTPGAGFAPGFNAAGKVHSVEFHRDIAVFVAVWERGTSGALGQFFGIESNPAGTVSIIGMRDGSQGGFTDQVSEQFFSVPNQVPPDPNDLLDMEALDDFGDPFPGFEGWTVRDFIVQQLSSRGGFPLHPGGDVHICSGP